MCCLAGFKLPTLSDYSIKILSIFGANSPICWTYWVLLMLVPFYQLGVGTLGFQWLSPFYLILRFWLSHLYTGLASRYLALPSVKLLLSSAFSTFVERLFYRSHLGSAVGTWQTSISPLLLPLESSQVRFNLKPTWATGKKPALIKAASME